MNTSFTSAYHVIAKNALDFLLLAFAMLLVPAAIYIDIVVLQLDGIPESSVTEYVQETLLFFSACAFFYMARKNSEQRGFALLVAGFFGTMFIREFDAMFDQVFHGFWVYIAITWVMLILTQALRDKSNILTVMANASQTRSFAYILIGLAIVLAFSRVFGTGSLWRLVLDVEAGNLAKNVIQEGLELLGYLFVFWGTATYCVEAQTLVQAQEQAASLK